MKISVDYSSEQDCLMARFDGTFTLDTVTQYFTEIATAAAEYPCRRLLNDIRGANWTASMADMFRFPNQVVSESLDRSWRRAVLVKEEDHEKLEFYEIAAVNKGLNLKIFTDRKAALTWLGELKV